MMIPMAETIKGGSCLIKSWSIFICFLDNNWLEIWGFICSFYVCLWKSNIHFICRKASAACHKLTVMIFLLSTANGFSYGFPISMHSSARYWGKKSASFHVSFKKRLIKFMIALVMLWLKCLKDTAYSLMDRLTLFFYGFTHYISDKLSHSLKGTLCAWCVGFMVSMFHHS